MRAFPVLRFAVLILAAGAASTALIAGMASWDASNPLPYEPLQGTLGRYEGDPLHPVLRGWQVITPLRWRCAQWLYTDHGAPFEGQFFVANTIVEWKFGRGLFDEVFIERVSGAEFLEEVDIRRSWLDVDHRAHEFLAPSWLDGSSGSIAFGTPIPQGWFTSGWLRWITVPPGGLTLLGDDRFGPEGSVSDETLTDGTIANRSEIRQLRAFGWPLRSVILNGVLHTVGWPESPDGLPRERVEYWNDGLGDWNVGYRASLQQNPAVGIAWKPIWTNFLANSVILGLPIVVIASFAVRAAKAVIRRWRGTRPRSIR